MNPLPSCLVTEFGRNVFYDLCCDMQNNQLLSDKFPCWLVIIIVCIFIRGRNLDGLSRFLRFSPMMYMSSLPPDSASGLLPNIMDLLVVGALGR